MDIPSEVDTLHNFPSIGLRERIRLYPSQIAAMLHADYQRRCGADHDNVVYLLSDRRWGGRRDHKNPISSVQSSRS
jgi:hypothetical protein